MRWLITGGDGQLARTLGDLLSGHHESLNLLNRVQLDITDPIRLDNIFSKLRPDIVVNTAAWTNVEAAEDLPELVNEVNAVGAGYVAEKCKKYDARLIHISTDYVFSGDGSTPWSENSSKFPLSVYGKSKSLGEDEALRMYPESTVILRTAWLYSKYGDNFVKKMILKAMDRGSSISVVKDQIGQPTCAIDLAQRIIQLAEGEVVAGTFHATNFGETSWYLFAVKIFELLGEDVSRIRPVQTSSLNQRAIRPKYSHLGQENWAKVGIPPMRNWESALQSSIPDIVETTLGELEENETLTS